MAISCRDRHNRFVRCSDGQWETHVAYRHPIMDSLKREVIQTIRDPDAEYADATYPNRSNFYSSPGVTGLEPDEMIKVCVEYLDGEGVLVTAFPTLTVKEGEKLLWQR